MIKHLPLLLLLFVLVVLLFRDSAGAKKDSTTKKPKNNNNKKDTTTKKPKNNNNNKDKTSPLPDTTTATADSSSSDGLTTTGKIIVGVLCAVIALLIIGLIIMFCYLKKASKVGSSVAGNSGNTSMTNAGNNTYYSPRPVGKPGPVLFDPSALAYNPPVYNKFIPPVQDPYDLSGGYRGYRPEYPPPYSTTVPYGGAFSRLITR